MSILEILEAHQQVPGHYDCQCGWERETFTGYISHRAHVAEVLEKHMREREALALEHVGWTLTAKEVGDARRTVNNSPKYMGTIMEPISLILKLRAEKIRGD